MPKKAMTTADNAPQVEFRCEEILIQPIVRRYENGVLTGDLPLGVDKMFRGRKGDVWQAVDEAIAMLEAEGKLV